MRKISIIIPLYNKEISCRFAIESVLNQTYPHFELIIINDGSTDCSVAIVENIIASDGRVKLYNQVNKGVSSARNFGVKVANNDYLAFLDADDLWHPRYLDVLIEAISQFPEEKWFGVSYKRFIGEYSFCQVVNEVEFEKLNFFQGTIDSKYRKPGYSSLINSDSFIIKKDLFQLVNGYDESMKYTEDLHFYTKVAELSEIVWANIELTFYRVDAENQAVMSMKPKYLASFIEDALISPSIKKIDYIFDFYAYQATIWVWNTVAKGVFHNTLRSFPLKYMLLSLHSKKFRFKIMCKYIPISIISIFSFSVARKTLKLLSSSNDENNISASDAFRLKNSK